MMIALIITVSLLTILSIVMLIMVLGCLREERDPTEGRIRDITGREIEVIRYRATNIGKVAISKTDILNVIRTIRSIQLGVYKDNDPYVPNDPYEGLYAEDLKEEEIKETP